MLHMCGSTHAPVACCQVLDAGKIGWYVGRTLDDRFGCVQLSFVSKELAHGVLLAGVYGVIKPVAQLHDAQFVFCCQAASGAGC